MRILVEHSGYDLKNLGDIAMLQACVSRLEERWPDAHIEVVCHSPEALEAFCPGTIPLGPDLPSRRVFRSMPLRWRLAMEQAYRTAAPLVPIRRGGALAPLGGRSLREAIKAADVVVAAGGGYLCDPMWWHGLGVLATLRGAQRLGRPTAMFGQGIGPLTLGPLRRLATTVVDQLDVVTLREGPSGLKFLEQAGVLAGEQELSFAGTSTSRMLRTRGGAWVAVTGDDALTDVVRSQSVGTPSSKPLLGVNIRLSDYSEVPDSALPVFGDALTVAARALRMDLLALPVSHYSQEADLPAVARVLGDTRDQTDPQLIAEPMGTPSELIRATGRCQAVVSGSYHAAVFALGQGVPVVGLSASGYYDQKFHGLRALYPGLVEVVRLDGAHLHANLVNAVNRAAHIPAGTRAAGVVQSRRLVELADTGFAAFADIVDKNMAPRSG